MRRHVSDKLAYRSDSACTSHIINHVKHGEFRHALLVYCKLQENESQHLSGFAYVALLKACTMVSDMETGSKIHHAIASNGFLQKNVFVGSALVNMYAKCGFLSKAQEVFDNLHARNVVAWNAIILGYIDHNHYEQALVCFDRMQHESIEPNPVTLVCCLKACSNIKAIEKGQVIHAEINRKGLLERNVFIGSTLIDMYVKCGSLEKAEEVFDKLHDRNEVCWNALITGYVESGCGANALNCFQQMQHEGIVPDAVTFICTLKACGSIVIENTGRQLHARIAIEDSLKHHLLIGNTLLDMYAKCGSLTEAQEVFDKLPAHDIVSWTALLAGYAEHGRGEEALDTFENMQCRGVSPCAITLVYSLKACSSIRASDKGIAIHAKIVKLGLEGDIAICKTLVDMYARCGLLAEAQTVLYTLLDQNVVSWNALITGYVEHGHDEEALNVLEEMRSEGICMNAVTFVWSLKACGNLGAADEGQAVHDECVRKGLEEDLFVSSALVNMYAKCGLLAEAQDLFDKLPAQTHVAGTALIAGYSECGYGEEALSLFKQLKKKRTFIDAVTLVCSLKACGSIGARNVGTEIHTEIELKGFLEKDSYIGISLVDMYMKCGLLAEAQNVFDQLLVRDVVLWTALIAGYAEHGCDREALDCLKEMQKEDISPNAFTLVCCLRSCIYIGATVRARGLHAEIISKGWETEVLVGNTLINMYAKWGLLAEAQAVFDKLSVQKVIAWTALITGYVDFGYSQEALSCFDQMRDQGISPDAVTLVCCLTACGNIGALINSEELHVDVVKKGYDEEALIGNTLIDTYGRCGLLDTAEAVFNKLQGPDVVSWNALIAAYSELGENEHVFRVFNSMISNGIMPDEVTFVSILNACNHVGLLEKGQILFGLLIGHDYGFMPTREHYTCLADMYGRAGHIDMAVALIERLPFHPGVVVWHTILRACQKWGDVELAKHAFDYVVGLNMKDAAAYVCISNIFCDSSSMEETRRLRP